MHFFNSKLQEVELLGQQIQITLLPHGYDYSIDVP